ncbi:MAG: PCRF domain-containing protein, partial [Paracoccaceae bacterium]
MRADTANSVAAIQKSLDILKQRMGWKTASHRLEEFNAMIEDPDLWNDQARAQKLMRERQMLIDAIETCQSIEQDLSDNTELIELGELESDTEVIDDAEAALNTLAKRAAKKELEALLDGEADGNDTYLEINAGAGGTESCDWANMLARMYVRWA